MPPPSNTPNQPNSIQAKPTPQSSNQAKEVKDLVEQLKEKLKYEGDYRDTLKESIKESQKAIIEATKYAAKIQEIGRDTINIKDVENDIYQNKIKRFATTQKINDLEKSLGGKGSVAVQQAQEFSQLMTNRLAKEEELDLLSKKRAELQLKGDAAQKKLELDLIQFAKDKEDIDIKAKNAENRLQDIQAKKAALVPVAALNISNKMSKHAQLQAKQQHAAATQKYNAQKTAIDYEESVASRYLSIVENKQARIDKSLKTSKLKYETDYKDFILSQEEEKLASENLNDLEKEISLKSESLTVDQAAYAQALKTNELYEVTAKNLKKQLDFEVQKSKQIGISGNLFGIFAEKLGVGETVYKAMTERATELLEEQRKLGIVDPQAGGFLSKMKIIKAGAKAAFGQIKESLSDPAVIAGGIVAAYKGLEAGLTHVGEAADKAGNFLKGMSEDSSDIISGLTGGIADFAKNIPLVGGLIGGLIGGFSALLDLVIGVDNKIVSMGRELNLSTEQSRKLNRQYQDIAFNSGDIFVTSKKLFEQQVKMSGLLGVTNLLTNERLATTIKLNDIADLDDEIQKSIVESSIINGKEAKETVQSVLAQVEGLKQATGIQFKNQDILKETANLSGYLGLQFTKYPAQLTKSLVTIKAMGLELKEVESLADSFLDFESSISKEFEAQLLTGKDINLAKAREAFLNNDLATAAQEITNQVGSAGDFLKLNRIQAESLAGAFGMSRDQLGEMLKKQELLSKIGAKDTDNAQKQLQIGLAKFKNQEALAAAVGEEAYNNLVNASTQEKIAAYIEKIKQSIVDFVESTDIISKIENFVDKLSNPETIKGIIGKIRDTISTFIKVAGELLADVLEVGGHIADFFTPFSGRDYSDEAKIGAAKVRKGSMEMSQNVRSVGLESKRSIADLSKEESNKLEEKNKKDLGKFVETTQYENKIKTSAKEQEVVYNEKSKSEFSVGESSKVGSKAAEVVAGVNKFQTLQEASDKQLMAYENNANSRNLPNIFVRMNDRTIFEVAYSGYGKGAMIDSQQTTKNNSNPMQTTV